MFEKCVTCDRLGKDCFPNLYTMPVEEIRNWARLRQDYLNWSYVDFSEASGVSVKTISASFSKSGGDVKYTTFAPMLCALVGGEPGETPCPVSPEDIAIKDQTIKQQADSICSLEQENEKLNSQLIQKESRRREDVDSTKAEKQRTIDALKQDLQFSHEQILQKDKEIKRIKAAQARTFWFFVALILIYLLLFDLPHLDYGIVRSEAFFEFSEFFEDAVSDGSIIDAAIVHGIF